MKTKIKHEDPAVAWELYIRQECRILRRKGISDVRKNWEAPAVSGHIKAETSAPDFGGCAVIGGHSTPVLFEAKRVEGHRLPLDRISDSQKEDLTLRARLGGIAFVYILSVDDTKHIVRWLPTGEPEILSPRGGSIPLDGRSQKGLETWLDYIERSWDV